MGTGPLPPSGGLKLKLPSSMDAQTSRPGLEAVPFRLWPHSMAAEFPKIVSADLLDCQIQRGRAGGVHSQYPLRAISGAQSCLSYQTVF